MTIKVPPMILAVDFDVDQLSTQLRWRFDRADGNGNPKRGRAAGSIYFTTGEEFRIRVTAGSSAPFETFEVIDCCLISLPQVVQQGPGVRTLYAPPSPFADLDGKPVTGGTCAIPGSQFMPVAAQSDGEYRQVAREWGGYLKAGEITGRWDLKMVLTVRIVGLDGSANDRVFWFDPETEVGSGVGPPT